MKILVIIVTYNAKKWIENCINSVIYSTVETDILVVDNGSTDGTQEFISSAFSSIRFIQNTNNQGFGAANNIGLRIVINEGYDYAYLLNQDAYLFPDTIERLIFVHKGLVNKKESNDQTNPKIKGIATASPRNDEVIPLFDILSPMQYNADGKLDIQFEKKCGKYIKNDKTQSAAIEVPFVMAAHWLISRRAIITVGGFSPTFKQYGEDDNYLHRLRYNGLKCAVVPSAKAIHDRSQRSNPKERRMKLKTIATIVKLSNPNKLFASQLIVEFLELIAMSIKNLSLIPLKFIPQFLKQIPSIKVNRAKSLNKTAFL